MAYCGVPGYILVITKVCSLNEKSLSEVFSEAPLGEHLCHVGTMQHDLPCKSIEWLLYGAGFVERCLRRENNLLLLFTISCKVFSVSAVVNLFLLCQNILQNEKFSLVFFLELYIYITSSQDRQANY